MTEAHELTADTTAELIRPTLDLFVSKAEPAIRKITEEIYEQFLNSVQDYLRENGEWNIGQEIERCRRIEHDNTQLRMAKIDLISALRRLEAANELLASKRSQETYYSMLNDGCVHALEALDDARKWSRNLLAKLEAPTQSAGAA